MTRPPTDLRALFRNTERRLAAAVVLAFVVVGTATIALVYGPLPALLGLTCLAVGAVLFAALYGVLVWIERWANREDD
jgi:hypothetical protein